MRATSLPLPTELAGVTVTIAGTAAPLLAVTDIDQQQQINFQVPSEIGSDLQAADVVVRQNGVFASVTQEKIRTTPPGVFRVDATHGAIQHSADFSLVTSCRTAARTQL